MFISAASGSGKTILAQQYAATTDDPVSWITLDVAHAAPQRLLSGLLEAIESVETPAVSPEGPFFELDTSVSEAAAVLAGLIPREPRLLIVDECEHLDGAPEAQAALSIFLRYCPDTLQVLLMGSSDMPALLETMVLDGVVRLVSDQEVQLTEAESLELAAGFGVPDTEALKTHEANGGWMAGVIYGLRYPQQGAGNDLPGMIMSRVFDALAPDLQQFLLDTSVPDGVTRSAAVALAGEAGHALWEEAHAHHLPSTTTTETTIVYHSMFRTFLRRRALAGDARRHEEMVGRYAAYLAQRNLHEEATEYYLSIQDVAAAATTAMRAAPRVCGRSDWSTFLRWADQLGEEAMMDTPRLTAGMVRALFGSRRFEECLTLIRRLDQSGRLRKAMEADSALLATAAWALQTNPAEAMRLLDRYPGDYRAEVVRYMLQVSAEVTPAVPPLGTEWGDVERIMSWGLFLQGRFSEMRDLLPSDPKAPVLNPNLILPWIFDGQWREARDLLARVPPEIRDRPQTRYIEANLLLSEGATELAESTLAVAINESRSTSFLMSPAYEAFYAYILARLGRRDDGIRTLERLVQENQSRGHIAIQEWSQAWLGAFLILDQRHEEARELLGECVRSMRGAQRRLFLPFAAASLSEAEARCGNHDEAHEAASLAYHTAGMMGCMAALLPALRTFPAIVTREDRRDTEAMRWRRLIVAPSARIKHEEHDLGRTHVFLQPFGPDCDLIINGEPQGIGRLKIIELTARLAMHPHGVDRTQLQAELFPDATVRNGGNHFRQVSFKFRQITGLTLDRRAGNLVGLPSDAFIESGDVRFEELARASSMVTGEERVHRLRSALSLVSGPYLAASNLAWAEERRYHLAVVEEEARLELSSLLLDLGRPEAARQEVEELLVLNRYSDPGYRLLVKIERQIGSESSVLAAYRRAVVALEQLGLEPGDARRLLEGPAPQRQGGRRG